MLFYSESGWVEHTSLRPNVSIPCTSFLRIKLLNIKYLLSLSACVCEHSLVVPFSSPPLCGCRPKTAVRGIRGTIHQLPVNTKYICCILHHQYINTEYINTKYARCILSLRHLFCYQLQLATGNCILDRSTRMSQSHVRLAALAAHHFLYFFIMVLPPTITFTMMWHKKKFCTNSHDHTHTLIFVMCLTSPAMWGAKNQTYFYRRAKCVINHFDSFYQYPTFILAQFIFELLDDC